MRRLLLLGALSAGCAAPVDGEARPDADVPTTSAFVVTTRTLGSSERMAARAAFVRVVDVRAVSAVTKTLGLEPDLPAEGRCSASDAPTAAPIHAELVDAGDVWIGDDEGGETRLVARAFPDLLSVSGVVYTTRSDELAPSREDTWVRIKGGADVDARVVRLGLAMPELHARRVDDTLTFDEPGVGDRTWVELSDAAGHRRCTLAAGASSFVLEGSANATITVHRDRRRSDGSLTVRAETVEIIGRTVASSGT